MSLILANKKTALSVRKDPNSTTRPGINIRRNLIVNIPPQIKGLPSFNASGTFSTFSIYDLLKQITSNWFPPDNFTSRAVPAGQLVVNGESLGKVDIAVIPGQTLDGTGGAGTSINEQLFSQTKDTASAWIIVKGNLNLANITIQPAQRKLFTVVYVTGNLVFDDANSTISMSARGANHSGTGTSGGFTAPANIQIASDTMISGTGAAGAPGNGTGGTALPGSDGSTTQLTLESGGGGGGWNDYLPGPGET